MNEQELIPELRIHLDSHDEPEEIFFFDPTGDPGNPFQESEPVSVKTEKRKFALILLAIFTAKERIRRVKRKEKIQMSQNTAGEFISTLATALTHPSEKVNNAPDWFELFFGQNPLDRFLIAARRTKDLVYFAGPSDLKITISNYEDDFYDDKKLNEVFEYLLKEEKHRAKKVFISVEVKATQDQPKYEISGSTPAGSVTKGQDVRIIISPNYSTPFTAYWLCSEGEIYSLYPKPSPELEIPKSKLKKRKVGSSVSIPETLYLDLNTDPGTESCIVLTVTSKLSKEEKVSVEAEIEKSLTDWKANNHIDRPTYSLIKRSYTGEATKVAEDLEHANDNRIGPPRNLDSWELKLLESLPLRISSLAILHIPNI